MKNKYLLPMVAVMLIIAVPAQAQCPSDDAYFCLLYKQAQQGDADAQASLGWMYYNGEGVAEDKGKAVRWFRKAAEQGDAAAQVILGVAYAKGEGVAEDKGEAVGWTRKAAAQGDADAQASLGWMYYNGEGVAEDKGKAVRWFRKAAEQGDAAAQVILGVMYWSGEGVIEDELEAYIWYSIAKVNGSEQAADELRKTNWDKYLTASEIKSAKREAARRLETIDQRLAQSKTNPTKTPTLAGNIALAEHSTRTNIAQQVFEQAWRSVVVVVNNKGQGSGVIIRPNLVATNCHVVDGGGTIAVYKADNRRVDTDTAFTATTHHADTEQDFCVLTVDGLWGVPATVRKYATLKVGENVYGLGTPEGLDLSLSSGLVSQLRERNGYRIIQTDAALSPGSSGGGLFDSHGNLIGIMTSKIADKDVEGIGFAIPADLVLDY